MPGSSRHRWETFLSALRSRSFKIESCLGTARKNNVEAVWDLVDIRHEPWALVRPLKGLIGMDIITCGRESWRTMAHSQTTGAIAPLIKPPYKYEDGMTVIRPMTELAMAASSATTPRIMPAIAKPLLRLLRPLTPNTSARMPQI